MRVLYLQCVRCKLKYTASKPQQRCGCGGSVVVNYDWQNLHLHWKTLRRRPFNHWRYQEFYPDIKDPIEMGEGGTPVVSTVKSTSWHFKIEGQNPTGSFKDRGSAIEVSLAREEGSQRLVLASTGNMGASVAAYCARAGLDCEVVLPKSANP